ncbi:MAG TPA: hypothetical protein VET48_13330, partial [Steroidobacteraceae bacterium]|nr:hypothetical protein [Steroidobacteraceae bacterium]
MNNTALLTALITSPSAAFAELRERPRFWLPLIVLTLASAGLIVWYYGLVDISWLIDRVFSSNERVAN